MQCLFFNMHKLSHKDALGTETWQFDSMSIGSLYSVLTEFGWYLEKYRIWYQALVLMLILGFHTNETSSFIFGPHRLTFLSV